MARRHRRHSRFARSRGGFTMLELLTTLIIILVLVGILLPTVKKMREKSQEAAVKAQISSLDSAIARYQQDFHSFPGPLPRSRLYVDTGTLPVGEKVYDKATGTAMKSITGAENLVLALMGGLVPNPAGGFDFDVKLLGRGPRNLHPSNPKAYTAYIEGMIVSEGSYKDGSGKADDSPIPEILDRFNNSLPILYLRAQVGAKGVVSMQGSDTASNPILGNDANGDPLPTQYDICEIIGYTGLNFSSSIGEGKSISASEYKNAGAIPPNTLPHGLRTVDESATTDKSNATNYKYPYDAFPYFVNASVPPTDPVVGGGVGKGPNATGTPRNKDRFILISAGVDRVYGTPDDITNAGSVLE